MAYIPKDIKFSSHKGNYLTQTIREEKHGEDMISGVAISEKDLEQSSNSESDDSASEGADSSDLAKSDATSNSSSGSSID
jgi:hypothetical protein